MSAVPPPTTVAKVNNSQKQGFMNSISSFFSGINPFKAKAVESASITPQTPQTPQIPTKPEPSIVGGRRHHKKRKSQHKTQHRHKKHRQTRRRYNFGSI